MILTHHIRIATSPITGEVYARCDACSWLLVFPKGNELTLITDLLQRIHDA